MNILQDNLQIKLHNNSAPTVSIDVFSATVCPTALDSFHRVHPEEVDRILGNVRVHTSLLNSCTSWGIKMTH